MVPLVGRVSQPDVPLPGASWESAGMRVAAALAAAAAALLVTLGLAARRRAPSVPRALEALGGELLCRRDGGICYVAASLSDDTGQAGSRRVARAV